MSSDNKSLPLGFEILLTKNVPHILEAIFFSLDYESFKKCRDVAKDWNHFLKSETYKEKAKAVYCAEMKQDKKKLFDFSKNGQTEDVRHLLRSGVDPNYFMQHSFASHVRDTPLIMAAKMGHNDVVRLLLDSGAAPNKAGWSGKTPLIWAASYNHKEVIKLLIAASAEVDIADEMGITPLSWAALHGYKDVVQLLLDAEAALDEMDDEGRTPLAHAAMHGHRDVVELLLDKGANPDKADKSGKTPNDWALLYYRKPTNFMSFIIPFI